MAREASLNIVVSNVEKPDRTILLSKYGEGAIDCFYDLLFLKPGKNGDYNVETSVQGATYDMDLNEYGEIRVSRTEGVSTGEQLFEAINQVMRDSYDRWDDITWTWDEIIQNLSPGNPILAQELAEALNRTH